MNKLGVVISFTFLNRVKTKSFFISTILSVLFITVMANIFYLTSLFTDHHTSSINKTTPIHTAKNAHTPQFIDEQAASIDPKPFHNKNQQNNSVNKWIVTLIIVLLFNSIMITGNAVATQITVEKSSRIMEILITSGSPLTQMFGKIIGFFLVGLLQMIVSMSTIVINLLLPHNQKMLLMFDLNFSVSHISIFMYGLILYTLGYFLYAVIFAAIGALVSRTDELGQSTILIIFMLLASFYVSIFNISNPHSSLLKVATYIPFTSPMAALVRIGGGAIQSWEIVLCLLELIGCILLFGWIAARVYRTGVLIYGNRPTFKEFCRVRKAYKT